MKQIVHASSFQLLSDADIAEASQSESRSTRLTVASTLATSSLAFASAFFCLPSIQVPAMLAIGAIKLPHMTVSVYLFASVPRQVVPAHLPQAACQERYYSAQHRD